MQARQIASKYKNNTRQVNESWESLLADASELPVWGFSKQRLALTVRPGCYLEVGEDEAYVLFKAHVHHAVSLIKAQVTAQVQIHALLGQHVLQPPWRRHHHVNACTLQCAHQGKHILQLCQELEGNLLYPTRRQLLAWSKKVTSCCAHTAHQLHLQPLQ